MLGFTERTTNYEQIFKDLLADAKYVKSFQRQITRTEGEPKIQQAFDWINTEDESYVSEDQKTELEKQLHPGSEEDDEL